MSFDIYTNKPEEWGNIYDASRSLARQAAELASRSILAYADKPGGDACDLLRKQAPKDLADTASQMMRGASFILGAARACIMNPAVHTEPAAADEADCQRQRDESVNAMIHAAHIIAETDQIGPHIRRNSAARIHRDTAILVGALAEAALTVTTNTQQRIYNGDAPKHIEPLGGDACQGCPECHLDMAEDLAWRIGYALDPERDEPQQAAML